jgi:hypothetical protein
MAGAYIISDIIKHQRRLEQKHPPFLGKKISFLEWEGRSILIFKAIYQSNLVLWIDSQWHKQFCNSLVITYFFLDTENEVYFAF